MKTKIILFILLSLTTIGMFAQGGFINKDEAQNKLIEKLKDGKWIEYKDTAWKNTNQENAKYYRLVIYEKGLPVGIGRDYFLDGQLQNEFHYENGLRNGESKWYNKEGKITTIAYYKDDKKEGKEIKYYPDGTVQTKMDFIKGKKSGVQKSKKSAWNFC